MLDRQEEKAVLAAIQQALEDPSSEQAQRVMEAVNDYTCLQVKEHQHVTEFVNRLLGLNNAQAATTEERQEITSDPSDYEGVDEAQADSPPGIDGGA